MFGTRSQKILTYMIQELIKDMSQHMFVGLLKFGIHWLSRGKVITIFIGIFLVKNYKENAVLGPWNENLQSEVDKLGCAR